MPKDSALGRFSTRNSVSVVFICAALCFAGAYAALTLSSAVFPQTNFPRVVILIDNGVMPADEMMAIITRPIEESMKDIPGVATIRSATGRGSAEVNVFFNWKVDMVRSELYVLGRLSQIRATLPSTAEAEVYRVTFSNFPIIGVSLISPKRDLTKLWEIARYQLKPRFLQIPGIARVDLVGGRTPEYHIVVDSVRLRAAGLTMSQVTEALNRNNFVASTGLHEEDRMLYLAVVDGRVRSLQDIESFPVTVAAGHPVLIRDFARVERGPEPVFNVVTADGQEAVLLNVYSQPDGSTLDIAKSLRKDLEALKKELPADLKLSFFYDQSLLVRASVRSVWEAILFGLVLSVFILYFFLKDWRATFVAILVIPVTVLVTLVSIKAAEMSFNLMTLGGIAAAIGLVIDDAIVVVEAIHTKRMCGLERLTATREAISEIVRPLVGSTLTPIVVFIPLAFLEGVTGVFFRALALTMVVALLTSLVLAVTLTPSLAAWLIRSARGENPEACGETGGPLLRRVVAVYERAVRLALRHRWLTLGACLVILVLGGVIYKGLQSEFLPPMDEGGFVIDYLTPPGTSLAETHRELKYAEDIIRSVPELESYSRRTGAQLGLFITEPNNGDFLLKLKPDRKRSTEEVISDLRRRLNAALPGVIWEFPGILGDLIGDLMYAPQPIEVKLFSTDIAFLKKKAPEIEARLEGGPGRRGHVRRAHLHGPVHQPARPIRRCGEVRPLRCRHHRRRQRGHDRRDGLVGPRRGPRRRDPGEGGAEERRPAGQAPRPAAPRRGRVAGQALPGRGRRRGAGPARAPARRFPAGHRRHRPARGPGHGERHGRDSEDAREGPDDSGRSHRVRRNLRAAAEVLPQPRHRPAPGHLPGFHRPAPGVRLVRRAPGHRLRRGPGHVRDGLALWVTGTSLNVVSLLGAIIGVGIVAKNGILMLDRVKQFRAEGVGLSEALVCSGVRRLRPVLMTSMAAALGMLPLAYGLGSGADMLKPLAVAVIGALAISVLLSLVATPTIYSLLVSRRKSG